jgi:hypothetical protein
MPFIGNKPSAVPLTSADITDNVITSAKIVDGTITNTDIASSIITGQTAETSIAGGDSILIYDDSATALRKMTRTNFIGSGNAPLVQADRTSDQSISANTYTKIQFQTERIDTNSIYSTSTYIATVTTAGKYFVSSYARLSALNGTSEFGIIQISNSDRSTIYATANQSGNTGYGYAALACSAIVSLSANDTLSVYTFATEAVTVSEDGAGFTIFKLIE